MKMLESYEPILNMIKGMDSQINEIIKKGP